MNDKTNDTTVVSLIKKLGSRRGLHEVDEAGDAPVDEGELAVERLIEIGADALFALCDIVGSKDWVVRYRAGRVLGAIGSERAVVELAVLLDDSELAVQAVGWDALARIDPRWEEVFRRRNSPSELADLLGSPDYWDILLLGDQKVSSLREAIQLVFRRVGKPDAILRRALVDSTRSNTTKLRLFLTLRASWQHSSRKEFYESDWSPEQICKKIEKRGSEVEKREAEAFLKYWNEVTLYVRESDAPKGGRGVLLIPWLGNIPTNPKELLRGYDAGEVQGGGSSGPFEPSAPSSQETPTGGNDVRSLPVRVEVPPTSDKLVTRRQRHRIFVLQFPDFVSIPAGEFLMGDADRSDNPRRTVYLDAYYISKYPVTVKQYLKFVRATKHRQPEKPSWGWKDDHPIVNVSWEDAQAYCVWASKQCGCTVTLPTEAQWEKAARGTDGRKFPWGNDWDSSRLQCSKKSYVGAGGTAAVGSYPTGTSPYGVLDMAGNVWEWCQDVYDAEFWKRSSDEVTNANNNTSNSARVLRGGSWFLDNADFFRCAYRFISLSPDFRIDDRGFRCAVPADSH